MDALSPGVERDDLTLPLPLPRVPTQPHPHDKGAGAWRCHPRSGITPLLYALPLFREGLKGQGYDYQTPCVVEAQDVVTLPLLATPALSTR